ncbi:MAG: DUF3302 domain-containing protein [Steroidobacteraceae bacterium]
MNAQTYRKTRAPHRLPLLLAGAIASNAAHASMLSGEALDTAANVLSWVVLVVVPVVGIVVFWLIHILPEKIAEQRRHPQAKAIQTLCLLSLLFGGLLWPLAWLWAYTKPVLHKLAYGTDVADDHGGELARETEMVEARDDIGHLRERLAALESRLGEEARG